jgi:hypothetical protein
MHKNDLGQNNRDSKAKKRKNLTGIQKYENLRPKTGVLRVMPKILDIGLQQ